MQKRGDFSDNIYLQYDMLALSNLYERAMMEMKDFQAIFFLNEPIDGELLDQNPENHRRTFFLELCYLYRITF